jgi:hypothetical protein
MITRIRIHDVAIGGGGMIVRNTNNIKGVARTRIDDAWLERAALGLLPQDVKDSILLR